MLKKVLIAILTVQLVTASALAMGENDPIIFNPTAVVAAQSAADPDGTFVDLSLFANPVAPADFYTPAEPGVVVKLSATANFDPADLMVDPADPAENPVDPRIPEDPEAIESPEAPNGLEVLDGLNNPKDPAVDPEESPAENPATDATVDPAIEAAFNAAVQQMAQDLSEEYFERLEKEARIIRLKEEYPVAGEVYEYLSSRGWPDIAVAAVIGNMMTECGGQTLDLQPCIYCTEGTCHYYGLCMWSLRYNSGIADRDVSGQLDYLMESIAGNMDYFGGDYEHFLEIENVGDAARYFNKYYERGDNGDRRARNANTALSWILDDTPTLLPPLS